MSGKYEKKNSHKLGLLLLIVALAAIGAVLAWYLTHEQQMPAGTAGTGSSEAGTVQNQTTGTDGAGHEEQENARFILSEGLEISGPYSYTGAYMEDGSNEVVSDILMIRVTNAGEESLQYAEITLSGAAGEAQFVLSTLMPGETAVVLESGRKAWSANDSYTSAAAENLAWFAETPSCHEDRIQIQTLDGGLNIRNISDEDITGEIVIYFKHYTDGMYYGGITYRGRIEGGLRAGEVKQVMSSNFTAGNTVVVFVTIAEE